MRGRLLCQIMHGRGIAKLAMTKLILGEGDLLARGNPTLASAIDSMS